MATMPEAGPQVGSDMVAPEPAQRQVPRLPRRGHRGHSTSNTGNRTGIDRSLRGETSAGRLAVVLDAGDPVRYVAGEPAVDGVVLACGEGQRR